MIIFKIRFELASARVRHNYFNIRRVWRYPRGNQKP